MTKIKAIILASVLATPALAQTPAYLKPYLIVKPTWDAGAPKVYDNLPPLPPAIEIPSYAKNRLSRQRQLADLPPPEFDRPYTGHLTLVRISERQLRSLCKTPENHYATGCAHHWPDKCVVYIVTDVELEQQGRDFGIVLRHELGHCNGWHHNK